VNNTQNIDQGSQMMKLTDIVTQEEFSGLFPIQQDLVNKITESISKYGYDKSQPITVWEYEDQKYVVVDGHTRMKAAEKLGFEIIPVIVMPFLNRKEAQRYTIKRQVERRNLTQAEILIAANLLKNKETRDGTGRSVEILSKDIGVSPSTLVHAKTVSEKASEEDIKAIKNGEKTINSVYKEIKNKKQKSSLKVNLVNIEDILNLLKEHNEKNAISVILVKYKNLKIKDY